MSVRTNLKISRANTEGHHANKCKCKKTQICLQYPAMIYIYKNTTKNKNKTKQMEHSGEWVSNPQRAAEAHLQTNKDDHCIIPAKKQHVHQPSLETSCGTSPIPLVSTHRPVCWIYLWGSWFGAGGSIMWPEPFGSFCPLPTLGRPPAHRIPQHTRPAMQTDCKPWPAGKQKT